MRTRGLGLDWCLAVLRGFLRRGGPGLAALVLVWPAWAAVGPDGNTLPKEAAGEVDPAVVAGFDEHASHGHTPMDRRSHQAFADAVDLGAFRKLAVFDDGRVKILDTLARERVRVVYGKPRWQDWTWDTVDAEPKERKKYRYDPVFTYLDLVFNKSYYADKAILHVEVLPFRERLLEHLPEQPREAWKKLGRISWVMFASPQVQAVFHEPDSSRVEMKGRDQLFASANAFLNAGERLRLVSPLPGETQWTRVGEEATGGAAVRPAAAPGGGGGGGARVAELEDIWGQLAVAWSQGDAPAVNGLLGVLAARLPAENPASYPPAYRLSLERFYNATGKFTIGYWLYAFSTVAMILALATGRKTLLVVGVTLLLAGLGAHTGSFAIRAVLSGRWAIHNQFESFIAISLFAVVAGTVLMFLKKLWVFGAASAALGTVALLTANLWAIPSNEVGQVAGILATSRILYVHVNMVLVSYGLIALAFFVSLTYLFAHYFKGREADTFVAAGVGHLDAAGGDGALPGRKKLLADLDRAQLTLMQLAFWLLGVGILLGAYWADHSWGRWWAWDPKETWALITWIVYLIVIHVRFGVRDRGKVTAWLSVVGFIVMLWTYKGVNLLLPGLHAYA